MGIEVRQSSILAHYFSQDLISGGLPEFLYDGLPFTQIGHATITAKESGGFIFECLTEAMYSDSIDLFGSISTSSFNSIYSICELSNKNIALVKYINHEVTIFSDTSSEFTFKFGTANPSASSIGIAKITALSGGNFVVVWSDRLYVGNSAISGPIHAQIFQSDGLAVTGDILVSKDNPTDIYSIDVERLKSGDFAIVWETGNGHDIAVKIFSPNGEQIDYMQIANTTVDGIQNQPSIAALSNGGFIISWTDASQKGLDTSGTAIRAQVFQLLSDKTLIGTLGADTLIGGKGNDTLEGRAGDDILDGKAGIDTATYANAASAVRVSLSIKSAQSTGSNGTDTLISIENLVGSRYSDTLIGDGHNNVIDGREGSDTINGAAGNDHVIGGSGNDVLKGGSGDDLMEGGLGNDTYYVDSIYDRVFEADAFDAVKNKDIGGVDTVRASIDYSLSVSGPSTTPFGGASEIPNHIENLTLDGTANLSATGNALDNRIVGNAGNNVIDGGFGADRLTGGAGADAFAFSKTTVGAIDIITDFAPGIDHIELLRGNYGALINHAAGALAYSELALGAKATTADQHLIYNAATGALFYDADGSGAQVQVRIAVLLGHPDLHASDIVVI